MTVMEKTQQVNGTLTAQAPFDYGKTFAFLGAFGPTASEQTFENAQLIKALTVNGRAIAFEIGKAGENQLAYTLLSEKPIVEKEQHAVEDRLRFFLSLDDQLDPFYKLAESDPVFSKVVQKLYGLHQPKFLTPFELACWAIMGQRIPWRVAHKMKMALVERFGTAIELNGKVYRAFPEPDQLAEISREELLEVVSNVRKADYLLNVIKYFGKTDEKFLREGDFEEVEASLRNIKGIGEWSSHFILVRGLGRMEKVSSFDRELIRAVGKIYGVSESEAEAKLPELLKFFKNYQGYFAFYARVATVGIGASSGSTMAEYNRE